MKYYSLELESIGSLINICISCQLHRRSCPWVSSLEIRQNSNDAFLLPPRTRIGYLIPPAVRRAEMIPVNVYTKANIS